MLVFVAKHEEYITFWKQISARSYTGQITTGGNNIKLNQTVRIQRSPNTVKCRKMNVSSQAYNEGGEL